MREFGRENYIFRVQILLITTYTSAQMVHYRWFYSFHLLFDLSTHSNTQREVLWSCHSLSPWFVYFTPFWFSNSMIILYHWCDSSSLLLLLNLSRATCNKTLPKPRRPTIGCPGLWGREQASRLVKVNFLAPKFGSACGALQTQKVHFYIMAGKKACAEVQLLISLFPEKIRLCYGFGTKLRKAL